jgi:1,4-dihydroxy-2-naphthoyl-CoA hydrolase
MSTDPPSDIAPGMNAHLGGWDELLGIRYLTATRDEIVAEYTVEVRHQQGYGIAHGGVHCSAVESVCSAGAAVDGMARGLSVVGLENHTTFVRAVRAGRLRIRATPITRGRRTQVWEATVRDEQDRVVATGRVRLLCLEPDADLAGEKVGRQSPGG